MFHAAAVMASHLSIAATRNDGTGISFDQLIDDIHKDLAMRYLDEGQVKLQELAFLLGFSTHASFSAAFKRSTVPKTLTMDTAQLPPGSGAGHRRIVRRVLQGLPAAGRAGQLQCRRRAQDALHPAAELAAHDVSWLALRRGPRQITQIVRSPTARGESQ